MDGGHGRDDKLFVAVAECLVLGGPDGEDEEAGLSISAILVDCESVRVELNRRCLGGILGGIGVWSVDLSELQVGGKRAVGIVGRHGWGGGDGDFQIFGDEDFQLIQLSNFC